LGQRTESVGLYCFIFNPSNSFSKARISQSPKDHVIIVVSSVYPPISPYVLSTPTLLSIQISESSYKIQRFSFLFLNRVTDVHQPKRGIMEKLQKVLGRVGLKNGGFKGPTTTRQGWSIIRHNQTLIALASDLFRL
jgi:hypothetical protein